MFTDRGNTYGTEYQFVHKSIIQSGEIDMVSRQRSCESTRPVLQWSKFPAEVGGSFPNDNSEDGSNDTVEDPAKLIEWLDGESSEIKMDGTSYTIQVEVSNLKSETLHRLLAEEGEVEMEINSR